MKQTKGVIFLPAWMECLYYIDMGYILHDIHMKKALTASHVYNISRELERQGLVDIEKVGRTNVVVITEKGQRVVQAIKQLKMDLD